MSGWPSVALFEVLADARSGFACGADADGGIFQFRMNNVTTAGGLDLSKMRRVPPDCTDVDRFLVVPGDVLFNATNSPDLVGKTAYFPGLNEPAVFSNHFLRLRPCPDQLEGRYLARWLTFQYSRGVFKGMCRQWVNQATVSRDALLATKLPLPPLSEQRRIADILDKADALRAKRRTALAQLDALAQSIFLDMFGDLAVKGWQMATVSQIAANIDGAIRTGPFGSQLLHSEFTDQGPVAVLGIDNVVENEFRWATRRFINDTKYRQLKRYTVQPGDVLITIMGTCGRCAIVPANIGTAINTKHLCCITLDRSRCIPEFLHAYFLQHPNARKYLGQKAKGAIMEGLNMGIIKDMPIPLAPVDLQHRFAQRLASVHELRAMHRFGLGEADALFASLQHRAFRGELTASEASEAA